MRFRNHKRLACNSEWFWGRCPVISNHDDGAPDRRRLWSLVGVAGVLAIPFLVIWWPGCREYPAVSSRESLYLMKLLYTACNTKDPARLAKVEQGVEKAARDGKLSPPEQEAFAKIIGMAKRGEWQDAERAAFRFAQDQVGQGHPAPHGDKEIRRQGDKEIGRHGDKETRR